MKKMRTIFLQLTKDHGFNWLSYSTYNQFGDEHYTILVKDSADNPRRFFGFCKIGDSEGRKLVLERFTGFLLNIPQ
jgi:hypothetical protein